MEQLRQGSVRFYKFLQAVDVGCADSRLFEPGNGSPDVASGDVEIFGRQLVGTARQAALEIADGWILKRLFEPGAERSSAATTINITDVRRWIGSMW